MTRPLVAALTAISVTALTACGGATQTSPTEPAAAGTEGVFVGEVEGTDAYIALVSDGSEITTGYLCDGKDISSWLDASPVEDGEATLVDRTGADVGTATIAADAAQGEVEIDGRAHQFAADAAEGDAGLYREVTGTEGEPGYEQTGWIVLADGSVRGRTNIFVGNGADGFGNGGNGGNGTKAAPTKQPSGGAEFIDPTTGS